ncbi:Exo-beta-1,3-glucanase [Croceitalea dokdonensis DOKDO 023]|uniref:Endo-1,3-beta-glucanase btgC n=1 Tax=Croceitalea dokdonensis DOKDO 023 TaxID=1300341 RepID=A0A0P7AEQ9_9FLAO|nr:glycosyl hydrolase family 17 protein [Croceitalea dokdonensis]KPM30671.1 Exo-beta-1,3-glucanase [Croceitalea dokdonensis DOKDO 023]
MKKNLVILSCIVLGLVALSCKQDAKLEHKTNDLINSKELTAKDILGNPDFLAMSYGGYRDHDHGVEPTLSEIKEDMKILHAMGVRMLRTYKVHLPHAANVLQAISELKASDANFEMYVMLGAWIDCKNAWTELEPDHNQESKRNAVEIKETVRLAKKYPDIVKAIAVGNEAMVKWATSYYVQPGIILKWVNHLQALKRDGQLPKHLWITSSDNFASWGGGGTEYHVQDLNNLIKAVDFLSIHTYPMHDTHYNPSFWGTMPNEQGLADTDKIKAAMLRAKEYAIFQYKGVQAYVASLGLNKPIHIGETGWASFSTGFYGANGSKATDEYKEALYYGHMRDWTRLEGISCFYFEAFDEPWKGGENPGDSEKHFGLFTVDGKAKYALWEEVDKGTFKGLTRGGLPIEKTFKGDTDAMMQHALVPSTKQ